MIEAGGRAAGVSATGICLEPDRTRVLTRFFVPGCENVGAGASRAAPVIERVLALDDDAVEDALAAIDRQFAHRPLDELHTTLEHHADLVTSGLADDIELSRARRLVLGAAFTQEYALEGAALCNPSAVLHPDQPDGDAARFILSLRCIGEGHQSSIGFRSGTVTADGVVSIDAGGGSPRVGSLSPGTHGNAQSSYRVRFAASVELADRVLWPHVHVERQGMEDARFVRFLDESGACRYYATYTAFDGTNVSQQLLETTDFVSFTSTPMAGAAASGKGLALFPRLIDGRYAALSRADRESNAIAFSDDIHSWPDAEPIQAAGRSWEVVQVGNCGSPIETDAGWLVFTHAVGPMRTYTLGAMLLALDEPQRVLARSAGPIIGPGGQRRDAYVPNVVYSCGAFVHNGTVVLPYGVGDQRIEIATVALDGLLRSMLAG